MIRQCREGGTVRFQIWQFDCTKNHEIWNEPKYGSWYFQKYPNIVFTKLQKIEDGGAFVQIARAS